MGQQTEGETKALRERTRKWTKTRTKMEGRKRPKVEKRGGSERGNWRLSREKDRDEEARDQGWDNNTGEGNEELKDAVEVAQPLTARHATEPAACKRTLERDKNRSLTKGPIARLRPPFAMKSPPRIQPRLDGLLKGFDEGPRAICFREALLPRSSCTPKEWRNARPLQNMFLSTFTRRAFESPLSLKRRLGPDKGNFAVDAARLKRLKTDTSGVA